MRCKRDILYILIGILFGYYHGIIRIWALVTAYDISWGSRDLKAAGQPASAAEPEVARHKESTAPAAGLGLDATRKEDLTEASAIVPAVPSPELLDVLAKYQRPIHPHESVWATSLMAENTKMTLSGYEGFAKDGTLWGKASPGRALRRG
ncbi:hypothetical protein V496_02979 [Pseudogymnoascus sp. VKM F-4515 (FW-2607)]|nr:hypothetical protein V496_02979 [Pseudogymnoascus sp. VKM F-4515 (FW-2607)]KFY99079.1 hypothetical protein V498_01019 [Pseudogymnoascus sp. VKM F-4517 (FW-2822)]